jgi:upstream activation factor subunit UAF30
MARATKTTTKTADVPVSTPVVPVEKKVSSKKTSSKKVEKEAVAPQVQEVAPVASSEEPTVEDVETQIGEQSIEFLAKLQQISVLISSLKSEYRTLEKKWTRELKVAQKQSSKRKRKSGNRAPSGFVKPTRISDELASFLGKEKGTEMARTLVTKEINAYIRANNLQDKENGRKINPDVKLTALLKLQKSDELTYFNLQRYMSPHFAKSVKPEATTA